MILRDYTDEQLQQSISYCSDVMLGVRRANTHLFTPNRALDALMELKEENRRRKQTELDFK